MGTITPRHGLRALLLAGLALCSTMGAAGASARLGSQGHLAKGPPSAWKVMALPRPSASAGVLLTSISCPSTTFCMAVGVTLPRVRHAPSTKREVTAFQSSERWYAAAYDGHRWLLTRVPSLTRPGAVPSVSCVSASFCLAVDTGAAGSPASRSTGFAWHGHQWQRIPAPGDAVLGMRLDCVRPTDCQLLKNTLPMQAVRFNGHRWVREAVAGGGLDEAGSLSCAVGGPCLASVLSRSGSSLMELSGHTWRPAQGPADVVVTSVDCTARSSCAVGATRTSDMQGSLPLRTGVFIGLPGHWHSVMAPRKGIAYATLSCTAAAHCLFLQDQGSPKDAFAVSGQATSGLELVRHGQLATLTCGPDLCAGIISSGRNFAPAQVALGRFPLG